MAALDLSEIRPVWRRQWLTSIRELSSLDWQRRFWGRSANPHHSFDEYATSYWDALLAGRGYEPFVQDGMLSPAEAAVGAELHSKLDRYLAANQSASNELVLDDPEWAEVVSAAERVRTSLLSTIIDHDERRELLRDEPEFP